jgi:3-oxoadipate enol-lactonase
VTTSHEACVVQPAHQLNQMDLRQVRDVAGIRYLEAGEQGAVPILFLHGIGGGAPAFAPQLEHFGHSYRAIAWEMPGYAGSVPLPLVTMEALAAALAGFIRALGLERPVLVGHSIGGMIVQRLLAEAPDAARAVVLAQTSAVFGSKDPEWAEAFIKDRLGPLDAGRSLEEIAPEAIRALIGEGADPEGVARAQECLAGVPDSTYRDMVLAMPGFDQREALPRIAAPTLVLAGSRDRNAPPAGMERMAARIPGARYAVLEGVGHLAYAERPAEFNAAVDGFLREALR